MAVVIPDFDHNMVLPPHRGDPTQPKDVSPYPCSTLELCKRFATTPERITILQGLLSFRAQLHTHGLHQGYQWLDGSFMEDVETRENRAPRDLDVLTIYWGYDPSFQQAFVAGFPDFVDRSACKANFKLDHFAVDAGFSPIVTVEHIRYWIQLFTHNRDGVWKGMVQIKLDTSNEDGDAVNYLKGLQL